MQDGKEHIDSLRGDGSARAGPEPIDRFTLLQKTVIRVCLSGFGLIGILAAFAESWIAGVALLVVTVLAGSAALHCFCSHCPYPEKYDTCYAMPPSIVRGMTSYRPGPLSGMEKACFYVAIALAMLLPQVWLMRRLPLFIAYWVFCLPTFFIFPFYICRRCRFGNCPFNRRRPR
jgi:hypothetical protein